MRGGVRPPRPTGATAVVPALRENIERSRRRWSPTASPSPTPCREFHDLLVALTPNATLRSVVRSLEALWSAQEEAWAEARAERGEYPSAPAARKVVRTHGRLVDEIEAGDADGGRAAGPRPTSPPPRTWCWPTIPTA